VGLSLIILTMSPGLAPIAFAPGSDAIIRGNWYGCTRYSERIFFRSSDERISCFGTSSWSKILNAGKILGINSILFCAALTLAACVYRPLVTTIPRLISSFFMALLILLTYATPTVPSVGIHHKRILAFSFGALTKKLIASFSSCRFTSLYPRSFMRIRAFRSSKIKSVLKLNPQFSNG